MSSFDPSEEEMSADEEEDPLEIMDVDTPRSPSPDPWADHPSSRWRLEEMLEPREP